MPYSINLNERYNNDIIYFNEKIGKLDDIFIFEKNNIGSFILCTDLDSLKLIREEILNKMKNKKDLAFNLITSGSSCQNLLDFLQENKEFENCIKNICIYCWEVDKYKQLYINKCKKVHEDIYKKRNLVINKFLKKNQTIKHYFNTKLITEEYYTEIYNKMHFQIAQFYGNFNPDIYRINIEKIISIINREAEDQKIIVNKNKIIEGLLKFDLNQNSQNVDELIINEYTNRTFSKYLNKCLMNFDQELDESVAYFTSRLIFSLNSYAIKNNMFCNEDKKKLYMGVKMPYSRILSYKKVKGKSITFPRFISTTESEFLANNRARRGDSLELYQEKKNFSVLFIITNIYNNNWISNGINVQNISDYKAEKEILFLPFSFFKVKSVEIDTINFTADIYLDTIGKNEILENQIKNGKHIQYDSILNVMKVVD
jgi:hypothetical protein